MPSSKRAAGHGQPEGSASSAWSFTGITPTNCASDRKLEQDLQRTRLCASFAADAEPAEQARVWSFREAALGLSMATKGDGKAVSFVEDTAVAPDKLRDYIARFIQLVERHGTTAGVYAHASVGCLHVRPVVDLKTADGIRKFESIATEVPISSSSLAAPFPANTATVWFAAPSTRRCSARSYIRPSAP
jgi:hypothetical protein